MTRIRDMNCSKKQRQKQFSWKRHSWTFHAYILFVLIFFSFHFNLFSSFLKRIHDTTATTTTTITVQERQEKKGCPNKTILIAHAFLLSPAGPLSISPTRKRTPRTIFISTLSIPPLRINSNSKDWDTTRDDTTPLPHQDHPVLQKTRQSRNFNLMNQFHPHHTLSHIYLFVSKTASILSQSSPKIRISKYIVSFLSIVSCLYFFIFRYISSISYLDKKVLHLSHIDSSWNFMTLISILRGGDGGIGNTLPFVTNLWYPSLSQITTTIRQTIPTFLWQRPRFLFLVLPFYLFLYQMIRSSYRRSYRQSLDDTSEWSTYAASPMLRGRAILVMMLKILPLVLLSRFLLFLSLPLGTNSITSTPTTTSTTTSTITNQSISTLSPHHNPSFLQKRAYNISTKAGQIFARDILRLGPLYIKIGQILSCRPNLFPEEWKTSLESLQDKVPAKSGKEAWTLAYESYGGNPEQFHSIFDSFQDVPIAAASLGQVHKARLRQEGIDVAIKLQRPKVKEIYDQDLKLMQLIAKNVDTFTDQWKRFKNKTLQNGHKNTKINTNTNQSAIRAATQVGGIQQSWQDIFLDAETILYREIDYLKEAENGIRFARDFGIGFNGTATIPTAKGVDGKTLPSAADWIRTPHVFRNVSNTKCLVMEYVPSIKISNREKLDEAGVTSSDRQYLADCLARSYLRQFCVNKFFSTDPHPGNLGVEIRENGKLPPRLVFYDFGQACSLKDDQAGGILDVIEGIVDMDVDNCVTAFTRMGVLVEGADLEKVKTKVRSNFETGKIKVKKRKERKINSTKRLRQESMEYDKEGPTFQREEAKLKSIVQDPFNRTNVEGNNITSTKVTPVQDAEIMSYFTLPAEYAFVARAISQMDGVGKDLDPDFDFISSCAPYVVEIKGAELYVADTVRKFITSIPKRTLDWQLEISKKFGFDPSIYRKKMGTTKGS